jgi:hypothetical protein
MKGSTVNAYMASWPKPKDSLTLDVMTVGQSALNSFASESLLQWRFLLLARRRESA